MFLGSFLIGFCLIGVIRHCNWEKLVIQLLYYCICIQICSGVLYLNCECASCVVGSCTRGRRQSCRVQDWVLCDLIVNFNWISGRSPSGWVNQYKNICVIFFSLALLIFELHLCHIQFCSQEYPVKYEEQPVEFSADLQY